MAAVLKLTPAEESLVGLIPDPEIVSQLRKTGLPNRRTEDWRWTDLRSILHKTVALSAPVSAPIPELELQLGDQLEYVIANGRLAKEPAYLPPGVAFSRAPRKVERPKLPIAALADAMSLETLVVDVTGDILAPIIVRYFSDGEGLHQSRIQFRVAPGASVTIIESFEGVADAYTSNTLSEISVGDDASVTRFVLQGEAPDAICIATGLVGLGTNAQYHQTALGFGAMLSRNETHISHARTGAKATLNAAYLLRGKSHADHTTRVSHLDEDGETEQVCKGVLNDHARGVFQGKFLVARGAQRTDARMAHNALLMTDTAEVFAKPELEIYADDVQCAHGNTAGALDEDALFYMRQRGLNEQQARAMLVEAFTGEVIDAIENETLRSYAAELIRKFMDNRS